MKKNSMMIAAMAGALIALTGACRDTSRFDEEYPLPTPEQPGDDQSKPDQPVSSNYSETYRPQIHYTPSANWINDPNGMVKVGDTYHLFYQYNPSGNDWGNMSWGHATSTDMIHWKEQTVALRRDDLGDIFSGSCVVDKNNTAGFGKDAVIAFYTSSGTTQQQSMAYSTDGGMTFTKYEANPVIANTSMPDFRDPKVFWDEARSKWVMCLAKGWTYGIEFWSSSDLKSWTRMSEFTSPIERCNKGQWECPDLLKMTYNGAEKWVLLVSVNPGGPAGGSGTMYFVGDFDGTEFVADTLDYPLWMDYGTDNYAGVTWSNTGDRHLLIGWMNNWNYAGAVPASPWRSAMTLPRELKLIELDGKPLLASTVPAEIESICGEWQPVTGRLPEADSYRIRLTVDLTANRTFTLSNDSGEKLEFEVKGGARKLIAKRNAATGKADFNGSFSLPAIQAPLNCDGESVELEIYVDRSSVEVFTANGSMSMTAIVFPNSIYNIVTAGDGVSAEVSSMSRIW